MKSKHIATYGKEIDFFDFYNYCICSNFFHKSTITTSAKVAIVK